MIIQKKWLFALLCCVCALLHSMHVDKTQKVKEIPQISLADMTPDIAYYYLQKDLTFYDVAHLRQVSKRCNALYDPEKICPDFSQPVCYTYACFRLAHNYYACTKALVHFACKKKEKIRKKDDEKIQKYKEKKWQENVQKFQHLWQYHHAIRNHHGKYAMVYDQMKAYKKHARQKNMCRHIVDDGEFFLTEKKLADAQMIFSGDLNLFDLLKKSRIKGFKYWVYAEMIISEICTLNDVDLLQKMCGAIDDRSFECIMTFSSKEMIYNLISNDIMAYDMVHDEDKKSLLHYAAEYGYENVIELLLFKKGLYVNILDNKERTPMHYAIKHGKKRSVDALLKHVDADIRYVDRKGRTAYDYSKITVFDRGKVKRGKQEIRELFKAFIEQSNNEITKIYPNGYQKLQ